MEFRMYRGAALAFLVLTLSLHSQTKAPITQSATPAQPLVYEEPPAISTDQPFKEEWSTISLAKSGLPTGPVAGALLSKVNLPGGCTRELLRLQWRPADPIDLYVIRPAEAMSPPVALFLLNYTFDTDIYRSDDWCNQARKNEVAIIGFGSALSTQRFHAPRPMKEWFVSELQEALATSTHDVQLVLNYLETRKDLDLNHVGIFGQGSGGAIAVLAAAADTRIIALDLTNPWGDWPDWLKGSQQIPEDERASYLKPEFLQKVDSLDPVTYLPELKGKSLRIQQVKNDPVTPLAAKDKIASAAPGMDKVVRYADNAAEHEAWGSNGIAGWLGKQLHPEAAVANKVQ